MSEPTVALADIDRVYDALRRSPQDGHFAVILFREDGQPPKPRDPLAVQFSIDGGSFGLDWVLTAPANVAAVERVTAYFDGYGVAVKRLEMNGVQYLRVEGDDVAELCRDLLVDVFGVTSDQGMHLITEGFDWSP